MPVVDRYLMKHLNVHSAKKKTSPIKYPLMGLRPDPFGVKLSFTTTSQTLNPSKERHVLLIFVLR